MLEVRLEPITRCSIRTSAREKGQWQPTQPLLCEILRAKGQSQLALASLWEMAGAKEEILGVKLSLWWRTGRRLVLTTGRRNPRRAPLRVSLPNSSPETLRSHWARPTPTRD